MLQFVLTLDVGTEKQRTPIKNSIQDELVYRLESLGSLLVGVHAAEEGCEQVQEESHRLHEEVRWHKMEKEKLEKKILEKVVRMKEMK